MSGRRQSPLPGSSPSPSLCGAFAAIFGKERRIFESLDFVEDRATVFHASYLTACEESGLRDCVAMGHFLLPPASLHEGFISIDELKKYSGNLYDFIPGCAHYSVCRIQRERNIFSVLKSKKRNPSLIHTH
ncbi:telomere repeats-binding bouquet formation protein 2 isoform X2 [Mobula hypostoma]|uniref:telomere repeats-binding bouquet formation protein 2 isoform X2 n=1 Tax=Mobula hypostoma TaxID=723540 RepID=UPI002FC2836B